MIKLTDTLYMSADDHQFVVGKLVDRRDKEGNITKSLRNPHYYTTLAAAIKGTVSLTLRDGISSGDITTLKDCLIEYEKLTSQFSEQMKPFAT